MDFLLEEYFICFIIFIRVFLKSVLLVKYYSNIFVMLGLNKEKRGCKDIISLNIRLIEF